MKMKMKTNITKRRLRKIIKEEIDIAIKAMIELEEPKALATQFINDEITREEIK